MTGLKYYVQKCIALQFQHLFCFFVAKMIGKWSDMSVLTIGFNFYIVHDSICKYVINCSTSVLPCDTCRFIIGIIPNRNIRLTKLWTFLFLSKSRRFMLKSPISKYHLFFGCIALDKMLFMFLKQCCITIRWPVNF